MKMKLKTQMNVQVEMDLLALNGHTLSNPIVH